MKLTIIIPAYNAGNYIEECLKSVIGQDVPEDSMEIIVIDDGSTDRTGAIADEAAAACGMIKVHHQSNKGLSEARNAGIDLAKGDYVMFVDSDDLLVKDSVGSLVESCIKDDLDILQFCAADITGSGPVRRMTYPEAGQITEGRKLLMRKIQVCAPFAIYRRRFLTDNGLYFYPGIFHEDDEFKTRAIYKAARAGAVNDIVYLVRPAEGSITRRVYSKKTYDGLIVMENLARFADEEADERYRSGIYLQIGHIFNWCLEEMTLLPKHEARQLENEIMYRNHLSRYLCKSRSPLHRIEGVLMSLFPGSTLGIYKFLRFLHFSKKHR